MQDKLFSSVTARPSPSVRPVFAACLLGLCLVFPGADRSLALEADMPAPEAVQHTGETGHPQDSLPAGAGLAEPSAEAPGLPDALPVGASLAGTAGQDERTELWTGSILSATFRTAVCTRPDGSLRGVLLLKHSNGKVDVYHVFGSLRGSEVEARHGSGHEFRGRLEDDGTVSGTVRLKSGWQLKLKGRRHMNVQVTDDCAPLP